MGAEEDATKVPRFLKIKDSDKNKTLADVGESNMIFTPEDVVDQMLDILPGDLWSNPNIKFLDPCCKSAIYLERIFWRLDVGLRRKIPDMFARHNHILKNQLFGLVLNSELLDGTRTVLYGTYQANHPNACTSAFDNKEGNLKLLEWKSKGSRYGYIDIIKEDSGEMFEDVVEEAFGNMKFDVIIGNPPYQDKTQSLYPRFIDKAIDLGFEYMVMVVKNNWHTSETIYETRKNMIDNGLMSVINYPVRGEVFKGVGVAVSIFLMKNGYNESINYKEVRDGNIVEEYCSDKREIPLILSNKLDYQILSKVVKDLKGDRFSSRVLPTEPFRIISDFCVGRGKDKYKLDVNDLEDGEYDIKLAYKDKGDLKFKYIRYKDIPNRRELTNTYKIVGGCMLNKNKTVISTIKVIDKNSVCTASWAVLFYSRDEVQTYGAYTYLKTRFARFLVSILCEDGGRSSVSPYRFSFLPLQDFTRTWTDKDLYEKYNLTQEEIHYIESTIRSLD